MTPRDLQPVQPARVVVENFLFDQIGDQIVGAEDVDGVHFDGV